MGVNDGGIKRGDRADTGDNEAQPAEGVGRGGSGVRGGDDGPSGHVTGNTSSLSESKSVTPTALEQEDEEGMTVRDADDPSLGLGDGPEG